MQHDELMQILRETGTLRQGHFQLTSGRHSDQFLLCSQVMQHPRRLERIGAAMAAPFRDQGIQTVVGPAMGGVILAYEVARALGVRAVYTEKDGEGGMALKRGFTLEPGEKVLVVEDAVTTGGSIQKCIDAIKPKGVELVGVSIIVDRSGGAAGFGVPMHSLMKLEIQSWLPGDCPLCRQGVPLVQPKK